MKPQGKRGEMRGNQSATEKLTTNREPIQGFARGAAPRSLGVS